MTIHSENNPPRENEVICRMIGRENERDYVIPDAKVHSTLWEGQNMMMVWAGTPLRVKITQASAGKHDPGFGRDVFAVKDNEGTISVLVVDDDGKLDWVTGSENFVVIGGKRMG